jgi:hypothetical protein
MWILALGTPPARRRKVVGALRDVAAMTIFDLSFFPYFRTARVSSGAGPKIYMSNRLRLWKGATN